MKILIGKIYLYIFREEIKTGCVFITVVHILHISCLSQSLIEWREKKNLFWDQFQIIDLAAMENGGTCIGYSNVHFGHARNLIQPGKAETMADGWETARKVCFCAGQPLS